MKQGSPFRSVLPPDLNVFLKKSRCQDCWNFGSKLWTFHFVILELTPDKNSKLYTEWYASTKDKLLWDEKEHWLLWLCQIHHTHTLTKDEKIDLITWTCVDIGIIIIANEEVIEINILITQFCTVNGQFSCCGVQLSFGRCSWTGPSSWTKVSLIKNLIIV